jgi:hypothetical protein
VGRACGTRGREEKRVQSFGRTVRRKEPLGRPMHRLEDEIKRDLREIFWGGGGWGGGFTCFSIWSVGGLL